MSLIHPFTIYNASAGSGKTYTLVKEYLKVLFKSNSPLNFRNVLALTFTNKAVAEMKERIIETLKEFSYSDILIVPNNMFKEISEELQMSPDDLHEKSKNLLKTIVHNYAAFDISTIDGFTHKLIRTFAYDLKLPLNFEVELDQESLLNEAVDSLIAKAGTDKQLTNVLVGFAIEKTDDDKSWDVSFDFNKISKLLINENDIPFIETLKDKTLDDFIALKKQLKKEYASLELSIVEKAQNILTLIDQARLVFNDFSGSYLPKHFKNLADKNFNINFEAKWQEDIENKALFPKRVSEDVITIIEQIQPQITSVFYETKRAVFHHKFLKAFYKNITPLSVLSAINNELKLLKIEQNKMLISEFNTVIRNEIKNQPTPFIYERIGEKFDHYFIDEFQDTSVLQWENLKPLLENTLASAHGSTMLVGDAKQAIYRWRGGKAEQFINLFNKKSIPFPIQQHVKNLEKNYRSYPEIVHFNNEFFKYLAGKVFKNLDYSELYNNANQHITKDSIGYVELSFLDFEKEDDRDLMYSESVFKTIETCIQNGYKLQDICVLVRKKKEGVAIANSLSQHYIPIVSSETLLINNSPEVVFTNHVLGLLIQPNNNESKIEVLNYLTSLFHIKDKHSFFVNHIDLDIRQLFKSFEAFNIDLNSDILLQLPLYDLAETIVRSFNLVKTSNAYIQFYLDIVLDYSQKKGSDITRFLEYFNKKKESLSIISPKGQNAVQIMTIHKSKGLEFPVVIFPYAELDIYRELEPKEWLEIDQEKYHGFKYALLNYSKDFENYNEEGKRVFYAHQSAQELDNINLLYVTLTRPIEQLYIISKKDISSKGDVNEKRFSGMFINYLKHIGIWEDSRLTYGFGMPTAPDSNPQCVEIPRKTDSDLDKTIMQQQFISTEKELHNIKLVTKSGFLWDTHQKDAIEKGNLIHSMMAKIKTIDDIEFVIIDFINTSMISAEQAPELKNIIIKTIEHPKLVNYFTSTNTIYNERDIISKNGLILRPDRIVINENNEAVIIDYKTGGEDKKHEQQLQTYQDALAEMNISVKKKILVYLNDDIIVKEV